MHDFTQEEMERAWLKQLIKEHRMLCEKRKVKMATPVFSIIEGGKRLGVYDPVDNSIKLAKKLLTQCAWSVVVEILAHETAHQYVKEVMKLKDRACHGSEFQEACEILGVHPDFRGASGRVPRFLRDSIAEDSPEKKLLDKVDKLLSLAQSANEHEASLALEKANLIIVKHNLQMVREQIEQRYDFVVVSAGRKRCDIWFSMIGSLLVDFFFVEAIKVQRFNAEALQEHSCIELIGTEANLSTAEYVFHFLLERVNVLWRDYAKRMKAPGKEKRSFIIGILKGFRQKMTAADKERQQHTMNAIYTDTTSALVIAEDTGLQAFYRQRYPNVRKGRSSQGIFYQGAYLAGHQEGNRLTINKPVAGSSGNQGNRLSA